MIRLLIAEDHALLRSGLKKIMSAHGGIEVVGDAAHGKEVLELVGCLVQQP